MYYISIDPGLKGAIAVSDDNRKVNYIGRLPYITKSFSNTNNKNNKEISILDTRVFISTLRNIKKSIKVSEHCVVVERLFPNGRLAPFATFNMGMNYGLLLSSVEIVFGGYQLLSPRSWQPFLIKTYKHFIKGSDTKEISISIAENLFGSDVIIPKKSRKKSDGFSDSLLIGEYVRLKGITNL